MYETAGYSDFPYNSIPHQITYYKWIERSYLGGLRIITEYIKASKESCDVLNTLVPKTYDCKSCDEIPLLKLLNYMNITIIRQS